ncbi:MAG: histidine phosphatase family protein, partial [Acidobacteriota bacterium]|nr:histidine phosphatase family protein [Acidobacteriota bacterium]
AVEGSAGWNEFDLDHVYRELAPVLCEEDEEFRREFEAMKADPHVDRRWTPADLKIVEAWIKGHPRYHGETWLQFHERISSCRKNLAAGDEENIAIFTSATPIGIWAALSMDVDDHRAMRLAGVLYNASYSVVRLNGEQLRLHTFNAVPHLEPDLRTYR